MCALNDLTHHIKTYNLNVDRIIAYSGAVITDGKGTVLFITPIDSADIKKIKVIVPETKQIIVAGKVVQLSMPTSLLPHIFDLNVEIYPETAFISSWQASKLRAIHKLLSHVNWSGTVAAFGDSKYDKEFVNFFGGKLVQVNNNPYKV